MEVAAGQGRHRRVGKVVAVICSEQPWEEMNRETKLLKSQERLHNVEFSDDRQGVEPARVGKLDIM
jgi:hypothetical protein